MKMRKLNVLIQIMESITGGIAFGYWQHSISAGIFAQTVLSALLAISYALAYGGTGVDG